MKFFRVMTREANVVDSSNNFFLFLFSGSKAFFRGHIILTEFLSATLFLVNGLLEFLDLVHVSFDVPLGVSICFVGVVEGNFELLEILLHFSFVH